MTDKIIKKARKLMASLDAITGTLAKRAKEHENSAGKIRGQNSALRSHHARIKKLLGKASSKHIKVLRKHGAALAGTIARLHKAHFAHKVLAKNRAHHAEVFKSARARVAKLIGNLSAGKYPQEKQAEINAWLDSALARISKIS